MELLQNLPSEADYTPLAEHQSQTPASFYNGPAVLHCVSRGASLSARPSDLRSISALGKLAETSASSADSGNDASEEADNTITGIDIWIASDKLVLARPSISLALAIPYRSIALHAVAAAGLYLQLSTDSSEGGESEEDGGGTIELTLSPAAVTNGTTSNGTSTTGTENGAPRPVDALFKALSDCADLHPDPREDGDDEDEDDADGGPSFIINGEGNFGADTDAGEALYQVTASAADGQPGLPPPIPGSGGWITAENVNQYFDEEGNWKGEGPAPGMLGPGAGTVREREESDTAGGDADETGNGNGEDTKWQRTG